jgi:hypothetical protein
MAIHDLGRFGGGREEEIQLITPFATPTAVPVPEPPRNARSLLAWLTDAEAIQVVLGRPALPTDDLASIEAKINAARATRSIRPPWRQLDPFATGDPKSLEALKNRSDLQATFASVPWRPAYVDLRRVLAIQKTVSLAGQAQRVKGQSLIDLCLPAIQHPVLNCSGDADGKGMTLSSPNLNLKVAGTGLVFIEVAPGVSKPAVQVMIDIPSSMVNVAKYRDRYFLRDGYHRTIGLLRAGKPIIPCVVMEVTTMQQLIPVPNSAIFDEGILMDERPPALPDFWNDSVAFAGRLPGHRLIRIRGDEIAH